MKPERKLQLVFIVAMVGAFLMGWALSDLTRLP